MEEEGDLDVAAWEAQCLGLDEDRLDRGYLCSSGANHPDHYDLDHGSVSYEAVEEAWAHGYAEVDEEMVVAEEGTGLENEVHSGRTPCLGSGD